MFTVDILTVFSYSAFERTTVASGKQSASKDFWAMLGMQTGIFEYANPI